MQSDEIQKKKRKEGTKEGGEKKESGCHVKKGSVKERRRRQSIFEKSPSDRWRSSICRVSFEYLVSMNGLKAG